jgi:hypothetical protein
VKICGLPDGLSLFYATTRPGGSGGFDLWVSKRSDVNDDFGWQTPENLGALINSSGVDAGPSYLYDPAAQEESLYFASNRSGDLIFTSAVLRQMVRLERRHRLVN